MFYSFHNSAYCTSDFCISDFFPSSQQATDKHVLPDSFLHAEAHTPPSPGTQSRLDIEADMQQWNVEPARYFSTNPGKRTAVGERDREERLEQDSMVCKCCSKCWMSCALGSGLDDWVGAELAKLMVGAIETEKTGGEQVGRRGREMPAGWIITLTWRWRLCAFWSSWLLLVGVG